MLKQYLKVLVPLLVSTQSLILNGNFSMALSSQLQLFTANNSIPNWLQGGDVNVSQATGFNAAFPSGLQVAILSTTITQFITLSLAVDTFYTLSFTWAGPTQSSSYTSNAEVLWNGKSARFLTITDGIKSELIVVRAIEGINRLTFAWVGGPFVGISNVNLVGNENESFFYGT